jgi:hypothetical protein
MSEKNFNFYHVVKNEDAYTFSYEEDTWGFIVAADGLGGSGSTVHELSPALRKDLEKRLKKAALPEYFGDEEEEDERIKQRKKGLLQSAIHTLVNGKDDDKSEPAYEADEPISEEKKQEITEQVLRDLLAEHPELANRNGLSGGEIPLDETPAVDETPADTNRETDSWDELYPQFAPWVEKQLESMLDDAPDTSALWGSRIAIMRFVYFLLTSDEISLSNEATRGEIVDYIYRGLEATRDAFELRAGDLSGQSVLPTTLVCLMYVKNDDGSVEVQAVWAGDSRGYALIAEEGLKQITVDDEDDSGAINNLFALRRSGERAATVLHFERYTLPARSAIFVCSDGVFDPFAPIDNIGVECTFLTALEEAGSFPELGECWHGQYKPMRHDDTTVAFVPFDGFDSFEDFKKSLITRLDLVRNASEMYMETGKVYRVIQESSDEEPDAYVRQRANTRRPQISAALAGHMADTPCEALSPLVTKELRLLVEEEIRNSLTMPICDRMCRALKADPAKARLMFRVTAGEEGIISAELDKLLLSADEHRAYCKKIEERKAYLEQGDRLVKALSERNTLLNGILVNMNDVRLGIETLKSQLDVLYPKDSSSYSSLLDVLNKNNTF